MMLKETHLADYFDGVVSSDALKDSLISIRGINELRQNHNVLNNLGRDRDVRIDDLIKVCDDFLAGELDPDDLSSVSFFLESSDHFMWNSSEPDGALIAEVLDDWSAPEVAYPINKKTVKAVKKCLMEGIYDTKFIEFVARGR